MHRLRVAVLALAALAPGTVAAAELNRFASSFEEKAPFGWFLDASYERTQHRAKITREHHQQGISEDVTELRYTRIDSRINLDLHLGLWKDFELRYRLPIVLAQSRQWGYALDAASGNSTLALNCLQANGELLDPNCAVTGAGQRAIFDFSSNISDHRGGLGDMSFGLAYAFFNQKKDPSKPTWVVAVDYTAPTAAGWDPSALTTPDARGAVGDRFHRYRLSSTFSKRLGPADPYFQVHYTLPFRGPGWYSNCDHPDPTNLGRPENCGTDAWTRSDTGIRAPHVGGVVFGTELNAFDDPAAQQKFAIDLRAITTFVSEGRYDNEVAALFGKLLQTQEYYELGGALGLTAHPASFLRLRASGSWTYRTEYTLTDEAIGKDVDGNGSVDVKSAPLEVNPNFDWRFDMVGRRLRASESSVFRLEFTGSFSF